jgi:hypothetical protein
MPIIKAVRDNRKGTATPQFLANAPEDPSDYNVSGNFIGDESPPINQWQQSSDSSNWYATADIELDNDGKAAIPLQLFDDDAVEGKETIKWTISGSVPFGFEKKKYTFTEGESEVEIHLSDDKRFRKNKTVTIEIEDNDTDTSTAGTDTSENDPLTGGAGANTFDISSLSEGIDNSPDFTGQESNKPLVLESGFGGGLAEGNPLTEQLTIGSAAIASERSIYDLSVLPLSSSDISVIG